jgi:hypothetical protein
MEVAELIWYFWQDSLNSITDRVLAIRNDATNGHWEGLLNFAQKHRKVGFARTEVSYELTTLHWDQAITNDPQHFVPHIWLQSIEAAKITEPCARRR